MEKLIRRIIETKNPTVVGLDPTLDYIPAQIREEAFAAYGKTLQSAAYACLLFNKGIIDAICDIVPAVKPQCAYYEQFGWQGVKCLAETIAYAQEKGMYVITDGKRNDIGSTMQAYAAAHLGFVEIAQTYCTPFGADALTVNGYLGTDGIQPLLDVINEKPDKGIFVLVKTSNPSSGELQDRLLDGQTVYEAMGRMCEQWGSNSVGKYGYSQVGAVVGATYPAQLAELRAKLPHTFFLVPGYGAQGGGAKDVAGAFDAHGLGAIVNSSRAVLTAWKKEGFSAEDYAQAARAEAIRMREDITSVIAPIGA
ncbi:MAG: orotidine-5'-phosphate decarboxylase [Anaerotruncus sp.]|nr:orotidine-5'-phosphate decarboxylase [Anaerotruncus sp.]